MCEFKVVDKTDKKAKENTNYQSFSDIKRYLEPDKTKLPGLWLVWKELKTTKELAIYLNIQYGGNGNLNERIKMARERELRYRVVCNEGKRMVWSEDLQCFVTPLLAVYEKNYTTIEEVAQKLDIIKLLNQEKSSKLEVEYYFA